MFTQINTLLEILKDIQREIDKLHELADKNASDRRERVARLESDLILQEKNIAVLYDQKVKQTLEGLNSEIQRLGKEKLLEINKLEDDFDKVKGSLRSSAEGEVLTYLNQYSNKDQVEEYKTRFSKIVPNFDKVGQTTLPPFTTYEECFNYYQRVVRDMENISRIKRKESIGGTTKILDYLLPLVKYSSPNDGSVNVVGGLINYFLLVGGLIMFPQLILLPVIGLGTYFTYTSVRNISIGFKIKKKVLPYLVNYQQFNDMTTDLYLNYRIGNELQEIEGNHLRNLEEKKRVWDIKIQEQLKRKQDFEKSKDEEGTIEDLLKDYKNKFQEDVDILNNEYTQTTQEIMKELNHLKGEFESNKTKLDEVLAQYKTCFDYQPNDQHYIDTNIHIGYNVDPVVKKNIPVILNLHSKPVLMLYNNQKDKYLLTQLAKYLICQVQSRLDIIKSQTNVIDGKDLGTFVSDITTSENFSQLFTDKNDIPEVIHSQIEEISYRNSKYLRGFEDITAFNKYMIGKDSEPLMYFCNLILNLDNNQLFEPTLSSLIAQGSRVGLFNIVLADENQFKDNEGKIVPERLQFKKEFPWILQFLQDRLSVNGNLDTFTADFNLPDFDSMPFLEFSNTMGDKYKNNKIKKILASELIDRTVGTYDNYWKGSTKEGIDICFGYVDGDKDRLDPISFNNTTVHGLMGGITGAGKSNVINVMIDYLKKEYPPQELELYLADFKIVEFATYAKPYKLAHATAIAATRDVDYCISLLDKLVDEMSRRESLFKEQGVVALSEYREKGFELPRILLIVDEFQQLFLIDEEVSMIAKDRISKFASLGRATGVHLLFASQSMSKTVSPDILDLFKLKIALPSSREVSKDLIGNDGGSQISTGYAIVNISSEGKKESNIIYRVPFIPTEYRQEGNKLTRDLGKERNIPVRNAVFFNQDEVRQVEWLQDNLIPRVKGFKDSSMIVLGEPTVFTTKPYPRIIEMGPIENSNLMILGKDPAMLATMTKIVLSSLKVKNKSKFVIQDNNPQMDDIYRLTEDIQPTLYFSNSLIPNPDHKELRNGFPSSKYGHWLSLYKEYVEYRIDLMEKGEYKEEDHDTLYFICNGFNSLDGLGKGERDYTVGDTLSQNMVRGGLVKVHMIFIGSGMVSSFGYMLNPLFNFKLISSLNETTAEVFGSGRSAKKWLNMEELFFYVKDEFKSREFKVLGYDAGFKTVSGEEEDTLEMDVEDIFEFFDNN